MLQNVAGKSVKNANTFMLYDNFYNLKNMGNACNFIFSSFFIKVLKIFPKVKREMDFGHL